MLVFEPSSAFFVCLSTLMELYILENDFKPIAFMLDDDYFMGDFVIPFFVRTFVWPFYTVVVSEDDSFQRNIAMDINYLVCTTNFKQFVSSLRLIKINNYYWDYHVKFLVLAFGWPLGEVQGLIQLLRHENLNAVILVDGVDVIVFKGTYCLLKGCEWNYVDLSSILCFKDVRVFNNQPPKHYTAVFNAIEPFFIHVLNNSFNTEYRTQHGVEFNLLNVVAEMLNVSIRYIQPENPLDFGDVDDNGDSTGNLRLIEQQKVDMAIGDYGLNYQRARNFYFTFPHIYSTVTWCVPHNYIQHNLDGMKTITDFYTILTLIVIFIIITIILGKTWTYSSPEIIFKLYSIFIGVPIKLPKSELKFVRISLLGAILIQVFINLTISTYLTSCLLNFSFSEEFGTVEALEKSSLTPFILPSQLPILKESTLINKVQPCYDPINCIINVAFNRNSAFAFETVNHNYVTDRLRTETNDPLIYCMKKPIVTQQLTIYMRDGFPFTDEFSLAILRVKDAGFLKKFLSDIVFNNQNEDVNYQAFLSLRELWLIFEFFFFVYCGCCLVFLGELSFYRLKH